jgi:hypothetical protein
MSRPCLCHGVLGAHLWWVSGGRGGGWEEAQRETIMMVLHECLKWAEDKTRFYCCCWAQGRHRPFCLHAAAAAAAAAAALESVVYAAVGAPLLLA